MMSYEKAARELPFLWFMFEMPIVVAEVGEWELIFLPWNFQRLYIFV